MTLRTVGRAYQVALPTAFTTTISGLVSGLTAGTLAHLVGADPVTAGQVGFAIGTPRGCRHRQRERRAHVASA